MHPSRLHAAVRIVGTLTAVALAFLLALRVQARVTRQDLENEIGPLTPDAYASATVPDAENSAIWWRAAAAAFDLDEDQTTLVGDLSMLRVADWTPEQSEGLERVVAQAAPALTLAERAAALRASSWGLSGEQAIGTRPDIPMLQLLRLARVLDVRARLAIATGNWAAFRLSVAEIGGLSESLEREAPLISLLVGLAIDRMAADVVLTAVQNPETPREALDGLAASLPEVDLTTAWKRSLGLRATRLMSGASGHDDPSGNMTDAGADQNMGMKSLLDAARLSDGPIAANLELIRHLEAHKTETQDAQKPDTLETLAGALIRVQSMLSLRRLERLAISVRLEGLATGRYPETLARWPEASAPDPFTGGALRFERRPDGSAVIEVPGAEETYNRASVLKTFVPYTWELPAPASPSS